MLSIYLKPTNYCNIGCEHCYLPLDTRADKRVMSDATLAATAAMALDMAKREGHQSVHFIWHGGEPLVLSPTFYWHAQDVLRSAMGDLPFTQSLQTSLIPYREEWSQLVGEVFNHHIGSSVDFTQRQVKSSPSAYLELWLGKVKMARSHGHFVHPGMVPTRHETDKAAEIYQWFVTHGFKKFNVERYSRFGTKQIDWPSNREHAKFLIGLFDSVVNDLQSKGIAPAINVVMAGLLGVLEGLPGDRWGTRCQREFIVVEPDGSLNTCPDRARHESAYANAIDGAEAFISSPERRKWIRINDVTHREGHCHSCEFRHFCRSGCPVTPNGVAHGQNECSGYKSYLLHIKQYVQLHPEHIPLLLEYASMRASDIDMSSPSNEH